MTYESVHAWNWSRIKHLADSPAHFQHALTAPDQSTQPKAFGTATHILAFEPDLFDARCAIWTEGARRGKAWEDFKAQNAGKLIFKPDEIDVCVQMADAVRRHPLVQLYLNGGAFERPVYWTDAATGLNCKAKPDWLLPGRRVLVDLKTTRSTHPRQFGAQAAKMKYHCQLAHYRNGVEADLGWKPEKVLIVAVESAPPNDVGVFQLDEETLWIGHCEVQELLAKLRYCLQTNRWPGRCEQEQALQLPAWVYGADDDESDADALGITVTEE